MLGFDLVIGRALQVRVILLLSRYIVNYGRGNFGMRAWDETISKVATVYLCSYEGLP